MLQQAMSLKSLQWEGLEHLGIKARIQQFTSLRRCLNLKKCWMTSTSSLPTISYAILKKKGLKPFRPKALLLSLPKMMFLISFVVTSSTKVLVISWGILQSINFAISLSSNLLPPPSKSFLKNVIASLVTLFLLFHLLYEFHWLNLLPFCLSCFWRSNLYSCLPF